MALTRPVIIPPWAETGDKSAQPSDSDIQAGWPLTTTPPSRQKFNWLLNFLANGIRYLTARGVADWNSGETYALGSIVIGNDNRPYKSLQNNNLNKQPSTQDTWWEVLDQKANKSGSTTQAFNVGTATEEEHALRLGQITSLTGNIKIAILQAMYPVGTPYFNKADSSNPNTIFGVTVGTWAQETGKILVGQDAGQTEFDALGETGGSKTTPLTMSIETRSSGTGGSNPPYSGSITTNDTFGDWINTGDAVASPDIQTRMKFNEASNLQPYVVYSWWVRTA